MTLILNSLLRNRALASPRLQAFADQIYLEISDTFVSSLKKAYSTPDKKDRLLLDSCQKYMLTEENYYLEYISNIAYSVANR